LVRRIASRKKLDSPWGLAFGNGAAAGPTNALFFTTRASRVRAALLRIGWTVKRQAASHATLQRSGWPDCVWAFRDGDEIGPKMLARIAKHTGLTPEDL
jgi:predicted RNA binding protein YcfA (HicA-like mRNA interferase family)